MKKLQDVWLRIQSGLWFVPGAVMFMSVVLALVLIEAEDRFDLDLAGRWPRVFGAGPEGVRGMLSAVATSMITVAGVVFSITILVLSQASTQYSPRVLRTFMRDRPTQAVLGVFVGVFAYCLVVLRTVRDGNGDAGFLPALAVLGGVVFALVAVATLVYFIHHVAAAIQADSILERIALDTDLAFERLLHEDSAGGSSATVAAVLPATWQSVRADRSGYLVGIDQPTLLAWARERTRVVRVLARIGHFVVEGQPIAEVGGVPVLSDEDDQTLRRTLSLDSERTVHQDPSYGLLLIVDVALKALSPGINDPTTAIAAVDRLKALLMKISPRPLPGQQRADHGVVRLIVEGPSYADLVTLSFDRIVEHARGDSAVFMHLGHALHELGQVTHDPQRRLVLRARLDLIFEAVERTVQLPALREAILRRVRTVETALRHERPEE